MLDEAGHFFLKYRAEELAEIVTLTHPALGTEDAPAPGVPGPEPGGPGWRLSGVSVSDAPAPGTPVSGTSGSDVPAAGEAVPGGGPGEAGPEKAVAAGARPSMSRFLLVAVAQLVSMAGSALTEFAIPIWIYLTTGSLAQFALFAVIGLVPGMLASPIAGAIVDRSDRRRVLIIGDVAAGGVQLLLGSLLWTGNLEVWHIYPTLACLSVALTFQRLAYSSAVPQLVPKRYLGHANGVVQMVGGTAQLIVPLIAVGLMASIGLEGILILDVLSYVAAITVVLLVRFPATMPWRRKESVTAEIVEGFRYSWGQRGLRAMLLYFAALNVFLSPLFLMVSPLVLSFSDLDGVARVAFLSGLGAFLGGLAMAVWGGPRRSRMRGVLLGTLVLAVFCLATGLRADLALVAAGAFGMSLCLALVNGIYATIVQVKVPQRYHGRVFALNTLIAWSTLPLAFGVVAPLGAAVAEPCWRRAARSPPRWGRSSASARDAGSASSMCCSPSPWPWSSPWPRAARSWPASTTRSPTPSPTTWSASRLCDAAPRNPPTSRGRDADLTHRRCPRQEDRARRGRAASGARGRRSRRTR
ncbi:MFS transporter [Nonomuraea antimicrobica]